MPSIPQSSPNEFETALSGLPGIDLLAAIQEALEHPGFLILRP